MPGLMDDDDDDSVVSDHATDTAVLYTLDAQNATQAVVLVLPVQRDAANRRRRRSTVYISESSSLAPP